MFGIRLLFFLKDNILLYLCPYYVEARLNSVADNLTFNVELADGDLDVAVDKLGEVQKVR